MKQFVIGDIHGNYKALMQCLEKSNFDYNNDKLIVLGDIVDGLPDTPKCVEELLKIKNLVAVKGNHDNYLIETLESGCCAPEHYQQGGKATMESYNYNVPKEHYNFLKNMLPYYIDKNNFLYVHGGVPISKIDEDISQISEDELTWDRSLMYRIINLRHTYDKSNIHKDVKFGKYDKIFLGHTSTLIFYSNCITFHYFNVLALDTGAGWGGKLTIMDVLTEEYWQSDKVLDLYPSYTGR